MKIVQITPGAGGMFCGNCFRDNALVAGLRRHGHPTEMVPLYLPLTLDEPDESAGHPIFFGGINVYLDHKFRLFQGAPSWLHRWLDSRWLLRWAGRRAAKTRAEEVGDLTMSMLRGEAGSQRRELNELLAWLRRQGPPDVVCLSNVLLLGLARGLRAELGAPIVCMLQGEAAFLDGLPPTHREAAWNLASERSSDIDLFVAPSHYFAGVMSERLRLPPNRVRVVPNGISLEGFSPPPISPDPPVVGFFARLCPEKGLDLLADAFIRLKRRNRVPRLRLRVGGGVGPAEARFFRGIQEKLRRAGLAAEAEFAPNLTRGEKIDFFKSISVFSVPALYGEAFGLYLLEAWAAGVPVVQPRHGAFVELVDETGGGILTQPASENLADGLESLLLNPIELRARAAAGRDAVLKKFTVDHMTQGMLRVFEQVCSTSPASVSAR